MGQRSVLDGSWDPGLDSPTTDPRSRPNKPTRPIRVSLPLTQPLPFDTSLNSR